MSKHASGLKPSLKIGLWVIGALLLLTLAVRTALDPLAARVVRRALNSRPGIHGSFQHVSVSLLDLGCELEGLTVRRDQDQGHPPLLFAQQVRGHLHWGDLLRFRLVADAEVEHAKVSLVFDTKQQIRDFLDQIRDVFSMAHLGERIAAITPPLVIERVDIRGAELLVVDKTDKDIATRAHEIWVHDGEGTLHWLVTRPHLTDHPRATLNMKAALQHSGALVLDVAADPLGNRLEASLKVGLEHLDLRDLFGFIAAASGLQATEGTVAATGDVHLHEGSLDGTLKLLIDRVKLAAAKKNLGTEVEALAANVVVGLVGRTEEPIVVLVPIKGHIADPKFDLSGEIFDAVGKAYLAAAAPGVKPASNPDPPKTSAKPSSPATDHHK